VVDDRTWLRITGLAGLAGGLVFVLGDMLFYYSGPETDVLLNMTTVSDARIVAAGITALVGTWLYVLGSWQAFIAFKPTTALARNTVTASFAAIFIAYGVVHSAYLAIATTAKIAGHHHLDVYATTELALHTNITLRLFIYPIFAVLSYVFITRVWTRKTLYPRWVLLFFPLVTLPLQGLLNRVLTGNAWIVIAGSYVNWIVVAFFAASTIALWNSGSDSAT